MSKVSKLVGVAAVAGAALTLVPAQANAAGPACRAPQGYYCVSITNIDTPIRSVRHSASQRCLTGITRGQTIWYPQVWDNNLQMTGFNGPNCEGNTYNRNWTGSVALDHANRYSHARIWAA